MSGDVVIRSLREGDSIPCITKLLHEAYAPLAAMGLRYTATWQDDAITLKRLARGLPFVGELRGEIVATVTLYPEPPADEISTWYRTAGVHHFGQFAVRPALQGRGLGTRLIRLMEEEAARRGALELALDTAVPAHHLRRWYERLGFREVETVQWGSTNYSSVILSKTLVPEPCP